MEGGRESVSFCVRSAKPKVTSRMNADQNVRQLTHNIKRRGSDSEKKININQERKKRNNPSRNERTKQRKLLFRFVWFLLCLLWFYVYNVGCFVRCFHIITY